MREKLTPVWWLVQRELKDQFRDWRILLPLASLTFFFPLLMNIVAERAVEFAAKYGGELILDRLVPFSILIIGFFPVTIALVVALESFVGEKERGTIEALLGTPFLDWQLYLGKFFVGVIFPLLASYASIALYIFIVQKQDLALPSPNLLAQLLVLAAVHALLMVAGAITVSVQSTSVRAANLLASFIILPVTLLIQLESSLIFWGNDYILWLVVLTILIVTTLLVRVGMAHFQREYLLGREIDSINLKWVGRMLRDAVIGDAKTPIEWYRLQVGASWRKIKMSTLLLVILTVFGSLAAYQFTSSLIPAEFIEKIKLSDEEAEQSLEKIQSAIGLPPDETEITFGFIFSHNIRAVLAMFFFGLFTLGILGELAFVINIGIIGAVFAVLDGAGLPVTTLFIAGVLPHGIFEIPAIILVGASILYFGAIMVTPNPEKTIGVVFIHAISDWFKIGVGIVFPLLFIAALIEAYITPQILAYFFVL